MPKTVGTGSLLRTLTSTPAAVPPSASAAKPPIEIEGTWRQADEAWMAWSSYDLDRMVRALSLPTHAVTRYYLLASLLEQSFTRRTFPYWRRTCLEVGQMLIDEFPQLRAAVARELDGLAPSHPAV